MYPTRMGWWVAWAASAAVAGLPVVGQAQNTTKEYEGGLGRQNANPEAAPGASVPTTPSTPLTASERSFLLEVAHADLLQMEAARIAARRSASTEVRSLANSVLASYARIRIELQRISRERGLTLPTAVQTRDKARLAALESASEPELDREYTRLALEQNRADVRRFERARSGTSQDQRIRAFAQAQLPSLERNVHEAQAAASAQRG